MVAQASLISSSVKRTKRFRRLCVYSYLGTWLGVRTGSSLVCDQCRHTGLTLIRESRLGSAVVILNSFFFFFNAWFYLWICLLKEKFNGVMELAHRGETLWLTTSLWCPLLSGASLGHALSCITQLSPTLTKLFSIFAYRFLVWISVFPPLWKISKHGIADSYGRYMFNVIRNCQSVFQSRCMILHSHQKCMRVVFSLCHHHTWYCHYFF